jgi:hypothetical protein
VRKPESLRGGQALTASGPLGEHYGCVGGRNPNPVEQNMKHVKSEPFEHGGVHYEIRLFADENGYTARVYLDDRLLGGGVGITWEVAADFTSYAGQYLGDIESQLFRIAKDEVRSGIVRA